MLNLCRSSLSKTLTLVSQRLAIDFDANVVSVAEQINLVPFVVV